VLADLEAGEVAASPGPPWVVLVDDPRPAWLAEALRGGVRGLLPREATEEEVLGALRAVAEGLFCCHPEHLARIVPGSSAPSAVDAGPAPNLTSREREILLRLAAGLGNKQIAAQLAISEHTVKFHLSSIYSKLDANSRAEAVAAGLRRGLVWI
jgi:NarL family two-component system response regulator YdfI